jgi:hypothetical protein
LTERVRLLYAFHLDHPAPKTQATYLVAGTPKTVTAPVVNGDGVSQDMEVDDEEAADAKAKEDIPQLKMQLVNEDQLEGSSKPTLALPVHK